MEPKINYCLYCDEPISFKKIKTYKNVNCDKEWNFYPLCSQHESNFDCLKVKVYLRDNGWKKIRRVWRRIDARDWESK